MKTFFLDPETAARKKRLKMTSTDPLVRSVKKVRREWRKTPAGRLQTLLEEERKWKRRATIAANKLSEVRLAINDFAAKQCVNPNEKSEPNTAAPGKGYDP